MRGLSILEHYRSKDPMLQADDPTTGGLFEIPSVEDKELIAVIIGMEYGWDHLSASRADRAPHWIEMEQVKRLFFRDDEWAIQFHPATDEYITGKWPGRRALYTLHIWRPHNGWMPKPPRWMVGGNSKAEYEASLAKRVRK